MKRIILLRDVGKDGSYSTRWGIGRIDWYVDGKKLSAGFRELLIYKALCISFGTRDLIICYWKLKNKEE